MTAVPSSMRRVRWVEPVLQGTNAVIVHPNTLGESQMAGQAMKVLHLR
jgi:hypothetical protein